jgi:hypothetical protein
VKLRDIIGRIKDLTGLNQSQIAAEIYDIKPSDLSNRISRNSINIEILGEWADKNRVSLDWLIHGYGNPYYNDKVNNMGRATNGEPPNERHAQQARFIKAEKNSLLNEFTEKDLAKEVSVQLLEIERLNSTAFKEACAYIKGMATGLKSMVEYDRRKCDRRKHKDENLPPDQERRIADRRKAVGQ